MALESAQALAAPDVPHDQCVVTNIVDVTTAAEQVLALHAAAFQLHSTHTQANTSAFSRFSGDLQARPMHKITSQRRAP